MAPILSEIIPESFVLIGILCFIITARYFKKVSFFYDYLDPFFLTLFQLIFTFAILLSLGLLSFGHIFSFIFFIFLILKIDKSKLSVFSKVIIHDALWMEFSLFLFGFLVIVNFYLVLTKGFIIFQDDIGIAKVEFYQGVGLFKRINQVSIPIIGMASLHFYFNDKKYKAMLLGFLLIYLILSLGAKSGLIVVIFILGAYTRFKHVKINYFKLIPIALLLFCTSMLMFYLIYRDQFLKAFAYRFISFSDGPVYYYYADLARFIHLPFYYMFDQMNVAFRFYNNLHFTSLGPMINSLYFDYENDLFGPNPQIFVESDVLFGQFYFFYYVIIAIIFAVLRKMMGTSFSFLLIYEFINPLMIDSQYAFSNLYNIFLLLFLLVFYFTVKKVILLK